MKLIPKLIAIFFVTFILLEILKQLVHLFVSTVTDLLFQDADFATSSVLYFVGITFSSQLYFLFRAYRGERNRADKYRERTQELQLQLSTEVDIFAELHRKLDKTEQDLQTVRNQISKNQHQLSSERALQDELKDQLRTEQKGHANAKTLLSAEQDLKAELKAEFQERLEEIEQELYAERKEGAANLQMFDKQLTRLLARQTKLQTQLRNEKKSHANTLSLLSAEQNLKAELQLRLDDTDQKLQAERELNHERNQLLSRMRDNRDRLRAELTTAVAAERENRSKVENDLSAERTHRCEVENELSAERDRLARLKSKLRADIITEHAYRCDAERKLSNEKRRHAITKGLKVELEEELDTVRRFNTRFPPWE